MFEETQGPGIVLKNLLWDTVSFSGIRLWDREPFQISCSTFWMFVDQVYTTPGLQTDMPGNIDPFMVPFYCDFNGLLKRPSKRFFIQYFQKQGIYLRLYTYIQTIKLHNKNDNQGSKNL